MIEFRVCRRDKVEVPKLNPRALASVAIREEQRRIRAGLNLNDFPAKPLSPKYAKQKQQRGLDPIRNLTNTGALLASRAVTDADSSVASVGFRDALEGKIAQVTDQIDPMLGVSRRDQIAVDQAARKQLDDAVEKINR